jgi:hypothetical protein
MLVIHQKRWYETRLNLQLLCLPQFRLQYRKTAAHEQLGVHQDRVVTRPRKTTMPAIMSGRKFSGIKPRFGILRES